MADFRVSGDTSLGSFIVSLSRYYIHKGTMVDAVWPKYEYNKHPPLSFGIPEFYPVFFTP
jgi:uncharacterized Fe-S cluster-containing MiaB family protein